jgi:hypothetical protein
MLVNDTAGVAQLVTKALFKAALESVLVVNWPLERKPVRAHVPGIPVVKAEQSDPGPGGGMVELPENTPLALNVMGVIWENVQDPISCSFPVTRFSVAPVVRRKEPVAGVDPVALTVPPSCTPRQTIFARS